MQHKLENNNTEQIHYKTLALHGYLTYNSINYDFDCIDLSPLFPM